MQNRISNSIEYQLFYKKVKNINLRVKKDGTVVISAPKVVSVEKIDQFVAEKQQWILKAKQRLLHLQKQKEQEVLFSVPQCETIFSKANTRIYPIFESMLEGKAPQIQIKDMESRWGICYPSRNKIVLSRKLASKPIAAIEYVLVHEYAHFFYPHHQKTFWNMVEKILPDWKERRELLKYKPIKK